jgi:hypothetical protein
MKTHHLLELFGHSIFHSEIDTELNAFGIVCEDKEKLKRYDSLKSKENGITFTFWYKNFYLNQIGQPKSTFKPITDEEVLLHEMTFTGSSLTFPFNVKIGDSSDTVSSQIGCKPFSKSKNFDNQHTWTYYNNEFEIMPAFDNNLKLIWLRIYSLNKSDRKKIELKENLKNQNKNIRPDRLTDLEDLRAFKPTKDWAIKPKDDSSPISIEIRDSNISLDEFIDNLIKGTKGKKAASIYSSIKKVTKAFNKINLNHPYLIDTNEREELVEYILKAVSITGFIVEDQVDLTEDWRNW